MRNGTIDLVFGLLGGYELLRGTPEGHYFVLKFEGRTLGTFAGKQRYKLKFSSEWEAEEAKPVLTSGISPYDEINPDPKTFQLYEYTISRKEI